MSIISVKFDVYFKRELGTLFKSNEIDLDGLEANVNLDLDLVESMKINYLINGNKLTDDIAIKDIENRLILIPFKSEVRVAGTKIEFEIQANMKNGDVKVSQTYVYEVMSGIGEGVQVGTGGSTDGHSHNNLATLHKITEAKIKAWDAKSDFSGSYNDLSNKPTIPTVDVTKSYVDSEVSKKADKTHSHSEYATPSYVQEKIAEASLSGGGNGGIALLNVESGEVFTVIEKTVGSIVLNKTTLSVNENETFMFDVSLDKSPDEEQIVSISSESNLLSFNKTSITFTPSNYNVAQTVTVTAIDNGVYTGNTFTTIEVSSEGLTEKINVTIVDDEEQQDVAVDSISISSTPNVVKAGEKITLTATLTPSNATNQDVVWSCDNEKVSITPNGLSCDVYGYDVGSTVIKVMAKDNTNGIVSDKLEITVEEASPNISPLIVSKTADGVEYAQINDFDGFINGGKAFLVNNTPNAYKNDDWQIHGVTAYSLWSGFQISTDLFLDQFEVYEGSFGNALNYKAQTEKIVLCFTGSGLGLRFPKGFEEHSTPASFFADKMGVLKLKMPETYNTFTIDPNKITSMSIKSSSTGVQYAQFGYSDLPTSNIYSGINTFSVKTSNNANQSGVIPPGVAISTSVISLTFKPDTFKDFTLDNVKEYITNNPIILYY